MLLQYGGKIEDIRTNKEQVRYFYGTNAVFVTKNKIVRLQENKDLDVFNFDTDSSSALGTIHNVEKIYTGPMGKVILNSINNLFDSK